MAKQPSVITGALKQPFAQQVAYFRNKMGNLVPTKRWTDMQGEEHDLGFMVAGAQKADLLSDLAAAVDRAISEGKSLGAFRQDFFNIVERRGWHNYTGSETAKGRAWRTRVIYQTNLATSYAAGRRAQLTEAGFDLWVYKHGGSRNPRDQHLAWDGLTLPKGHPFWKTHYPPAQNVYGCSCYVLGAYSNAAAQRLGADPDKSLPDNWQADADTPGYPLGERVADTVRVMAEKTRQWEYELAKAYMQGLPTGVRDRFATSYRGLPSVADDTRRYARSVLENLQDVERAPYRTLGLLTEQDAAAVLRLKGIDVAGFDFALDVSAVKHVHKHHGHDKTERSRGQRAVAGHDYAFLPAILNAPDSIEDLGENEAGVSLLRYRKQVDGERFNAVFGVRRGRKMLALVTLYIQP